jgi:hypothetical protein
MILTESYIKNVLIKPIVEKVLKEATVIPKPENQPCVDFWNPYLDALNNDNNLDDNWVKIKYRLKDYLTRNSILKNCNSAPLSKYQSWGKILENIIKEISTFFKDENGSPISLNDIKWGTNLLGIPTIILDILIALDETREKYYKEYLEYTKTLKKKKTSDIPSDMSSDSLEGGDDIPSDLPKKVVKKKKRGDISSDLPKNPIDKLKYSLDNFNAWTRKYVIYKNVSEQKYDIINIKTLEEKKGKNQKCGVISIEKIKNSLTKQDVEDVKNWEESWENNSLDEIITYNWEDAINLNMIPKKIIKNGYDAYAFELIVLQLSGIAGKEFKEVNASVIDKTINWSSVGIVRTGGSVDD